MPRHLKGLAGLILLTFLSGCGSTPQTPAANYAAFAASKGQWVVDVKGLDPQKTEQVKAAIEGVAGVEKGTALINSSGNYVAFKTTVSTSDGKSHGAVRNDVVKALEAMGLKAGESKTQL